jgi:hypothetical protein
MAQPATVFITYLLENNGGLQQNVSFGYKTPIHCNYIQRIETDDAISGKTVTISFPDTEEFRFMRGPSEITSANNGYGWTADKFYILMQVVEGIGDNISPLPDQWKKFDKTSSINNYSTWFNKAIPPADLKVSKFFITGSDYLSNNIYYDLSYLNYPTSTDDTNLQFGEEVFFYGNVKGKIAATIQSMRINAILPLNEFNTSQNPTWTLGDSVYITEIGIYDEDGVLLGIGKMNLPIDKDSNKYRTIEFKLDF